MKNYVFDDFKEVEKSIQNEAPPIVYKYRSDWNNPYHRNLITKQSIWFASPKELNDLYDIRTPVQYDLKEIEDPRFFELMKRTYKEHHPTITFDEREINLICEKQLDEINKNPKAFFDARYQSIRDDETFDNVGVFSCTVDELNVTMWAHYGGNNKGFIIGFNTVDLARDLLCTVSAVNYNNNVPIFKFLDRTLDDELDTYFLKSEDWRYEKEFRFLSVVFNTTITRLKSYSKDSVAEFILGSEFPLNQKQEFIDEIEKTFSSAIPIYQLRYRVSGYGFDKYRI